MPQDAFAGPHTVKKLDKLEAYLKAYLNVLKNQTLRTIYFDAFAGTGEIPTAAGDPSLPLDDEGRAFILGSAKRALGLQSKFTEYVFVEKSRAKAKELADAVKKQHLDVSDRVRVLNEDANVALQSFCRSTNWRKSRSVVFLDPYGHQVEWTTIEAVAATKAIDLWYLFPAGLGVHRQIGRDAHVDADKERSLDRIFGTPTWRQAFINQEERPADLFYEAEQQFTKTATPESITRFMIERMASAFEGGVLEEWLPLGSRGVHMYSLLFACANPSPKANALARKLARAVMRSGRRGRTERH